MPFGLERGKRFNTDKRSRYYYVGDYTKRQTSLASSAIPSGVSVFVFTAFTFIRRVFVDSRQRGRRGTKRCVARCDGRSVGEAVKASQFCIFLEALFTYSLDIMNASVTRTRDESVKSVRGKGEKTGH